MNLSQKLIKMQAIDDKITAFLQESGHLPQQLKQLQDAVAQDEQNLQAAVDEQKACKEAQGKLNLDVESNKGLIDKYQQQLNSVTNNKEYKALNSEIALLKGKNSDIDEKVLKLMEKEKLLGEQKKEAEEKTQQSKSALEAGQTEIKAKIDVVKKQIEEQKAQRNAIAKELPIGVVKQYVLLIKKKDRKAVAFAHKEACSECGFRLRPQLLLELESGTQTKVCENCGRFLVGSPKTDE